MPSMSQVLLTEPPVFPMLVGHTQVVVDDRCLVERWLHVNHLRLCQPHCRILCKKFSEIIARETASNHPRELEALYHKLRYNASIFLIRFGNLINLPLVH